VRRFFKTWSSEARGAARSQASARAATGTVGRSRTSVPRWNGRGEQPRWARSTPRWTGRQSQRGAELVHGGQKVGGERATVARSERTARALARRAAIHGGMVGEPTRAECRAIVTCDAGRADSQQSARRSTVEWSRSERECQSIAKADASFARCSKARLFNARRGATRDRLRRRPWIATLRIASARRIKFKGSGLRISPSIPRETPQGRRDRFSSSHSAACQVRN
jgi:hypothetical protein